MSATKSVPCPRCGFRDGNLVHVCRVPETTQATSVPVQFKPGQTVWHARLKLLSGTIIAQHEDRVWIKGPCIGAAYLGLAADFTATDPNAKPLPPWEKTDSKPEQKFGPHDYPYQDGTSDCRHGCGCWMGPCRSGGPPGVNQFGECPKNPLPNTPADSEPLTEEWLRNVGLWAGIGEFYKIRMMFQDDYPVTLDSLLNGICVSSRNTTCKTRDDARQLCRLLGVPLKE